MENWAPSEVWALLVMLGSEKKPRQRVDKTQTNKRVPGITFLLSFFIN